MFFLIIVWRIIYIANLEKLQLADEKVSNALTEKNRLVIEMRVIFCFNGSEGGG